DSKINTFFPHLTNRKYEKSSHHIDVSYRKSNQLWKKFIQSLPKANHDDHSIEINQNHVVVEVRLVRVFNHQAELEPHLVVAVVVLVLVEVSVEVPVEQQVLRLVVLV
ncbi:hypothetical protein BLA29_013998, partial [Euroglyphus maynei]